MRFNNIENFPKSIQNKKGFTALSNDMVLPKEEWDANYPHLTFRITTLSEYVQIITLVTSVSQNYFDYDLIYRGISDKNWALIPSISRSNENIFSEFRITEEFRTLKPQLFSNLESNFDVLSVMQHYGLPTRLLDFTLNPLVALYFACESNDRKDARVVSQLVQYLKYPDDRQSLIIEAICSLHKIMLVDDFWIEDWINGFGSTLFDYLFCLYIVSGNRSLVIRPKYWNERQVRQSSVFMVFPNEIRDIGASFVSWHVDKDTSAHPMVRELALTIKKNENIHKIYGTESDFIVLRK